MKFETPLLLQGNQSILLVLVYDAIFGKGLPKNCKYELLDGYTDQLVQALEEVSLEFPELVKNETQSKNFGLFIWLYLIGQ